jgi:hypothetical protein
MARRIPWGLVCCLVLLLAFEGFVRGLRPGGAVPYAFSEQEYRSIPAELQRVGAAEVAIVGSSRAREAIALPELAADLEERAGRKVTVASYAVAGGRAAEVRVIARRLLGARPRPELVLYGVGPRQLLEREDPGMALGRIWGLADWVRARLELGRGPTAPWLGASLRNSAGRHAYAVRFQPQVHAALTEPSEGLKKAFTEAPGLKYAPTRGRHTIWQTRSPNKSIDISPSRARSYLDKVLDGRPYDLDPAQLGRMDDTLELLGEAGVLVVLFEVPIQPVLAEQFPEGTLQEFQRLMVELAERHGVEYLPAAGLVPDLPRSGFREQSHLNLAGARLLTAALVERVGFEAGP